MPLNALLVTFPAREKSPVGDRTAIDNMKLLRGKAAQKKERCPRAALSLYAVYN